MTAQRVPLEEQILEVEREIRQRARVYPQWVEKGHYKPDTADAKLAAMRAVQSTLTWLDLNLHWIKPEAERRRLHAEALAEIAAHPAVTAVTETFPDAVITGVRERVSPNVQPEHQDAAE